jgi:hypothetical protein
VQHVKVQNIYGSTFGDTQGAVHSETYEKGQVPVKDDRFKTSSHVNFGDPKKKYHAPAHAIVGVTPIEKKVEPVSFINKSILNLILN